VPFILVKQSERKCGNREEAPKEIADTVAISGTERIEE